MKTNPPGKLFVIDGTDGSGKATQTRFLVERFKKEGREVETIDFPRYSTNLVGKLIRESLDGKHGDFLGLDPKLASIPYAVDRFETKPLIEGWLAAGKIVVADRYVSANQIHQGGKITDAEARTAFLAWLDQLEFGVLKLPRPDAIVYLHAPIEVTMRLAAERARAKGEAPDRAEVNAKHQAESQEGALAVIKASNNWFRVDCGNGADGLLSPEVIHEQVYAAFKRFLP